MPGRWLALHKHVPLQAGAVQLTDVTVRGQEGLPGASECQEAQPPTITPHHVLSHYNLPVGSVGQYYVWPERASKHMYLVF